MSHSGSPAGFCFHTLYHSQETKYWVEKPACKDDTSLSHSRALGISPLAATLLHKIFIIALLALIGFLHLVFSGKSMTNFAFDTVHWGSPLLTNLFLSLCWLIAPSLGLRAVAENALEAGASRCPFQVKRLDETRWIWLYVIDVSDQQADAVGIAFHSWGHMILHAITASHQVHVPCCLMPKIMLYLHLLDSCLHFFWYKFSPLLALAQVLAHHHATTSPRSCSCHSYQQHPFLQSGF